jgi:cytochrome c oxidase subunit 3
MQPETSALTAEGYLPPPAVAHHFSGRATQDYAARLGMWLFLSTEVLLFAGMFVSYAVYRTLYPEAFDRAAHLLNVWLGTGNTFLLLTSSLTVALAHHFAAQGKNRVAFWLLLASILMGFGFLCIKYLEYAHKFHEHELPGKFFGYILAPGRPDGIPPEHVVGASMFFTVYFFATALHAIHVIIGMTILGWVAYKCWHKTFSPSYNTPVELGGLYWHLVDLVWIFLYPLLYLV